MMDCEHSVHKRAPSHVMASGCYDSHPKYNYMSSSFSPASRTHMVTVSAHKSLQFTSLDHEPQSMTSRAMVVMPHSRTSIEEPRSRLSQSIDDPHLVY
jgi:hypothetical protein